MLVTEPASGVVVEPAEPGRWDDVLRLISGPSQQCTCQYWRMSSGDYGRSTLDQRVEALRRQIEDQPAPGMVAYVDGQAVGWCGFGVRSGLERLVRSRTIPAIDDRPVWSIICFQVRPGHRRRGVTHALLQAVIEYAKVMDAPALEAYPVDPGGKRLNTTDLYVGTVSLFEKAGFRRVVETDARSARLPRWLMRLELS